MRGFAKRGTAGASPDDRIERLAGPPQTRWDTVLIWFMRITALLWIAKGVLTWAEILDLRPLAEPFGERSLGRQATIVYFAVIDLTAAVGLWLTSAWGGVVWLLSATSAVTLALLAAHLLPRSPVILGVEAILIVIYFALSWLAAREPR